jgi:hypothetical protein
MPCRLSHLLKQPSKPLAEMASTRLRYSRCYAEYWMAELALAKPPLSGLRRKSAQWLRPELRVRVKHLKAKGTLRRAIVKALLDD